MKKRFLFSSLVLTLALAGSSCKSEFEKIRGSGDTELMFKKAFEFYKAEEYLRAQALFELIIPAYRGRPELERVYFTYSDTYYKVGKYVMANYYYKNFATTFPTSSLKEEAEFMAAYSNYMMSPTYRLDQSYTDKAIEEFQSFVNTYPTSERVKECNRLIDQMRLKLEKKAFEEGVLYYNIKQYQAATVSLDNLLRDFPETANAEQVRFLMAKAAFELAENSVYEKQEERYRKTVGYAKDYLVKFKDSDNRKEVKSIHDSSVKKLKSLTNGRYQDKISRTGS